MPRGDLNLNRLWPSLIAKNNNLFLWSKLSLEVHFVCELIRNYGKIIVFERVEIRWELFIVNFDVIYRVFDFIFSFKFTYQSSIGVVPKIVKAFYRYTSAKRFSILQWSCLNTLRTSALVITSEIFEVIAFAIVYYSSKFFRFKVTPRNRCSCWTVFLAKCLMQTVDSLCEPSSCWLRWSEFSMVVFDLFQYRTC